MTDPLDLLAESEAKVAQLQNELALARRKPRVRVLDPLAADAFSRPYTGRAARPAGFDRVNPGMPPALQLGVDAKPKPRVARAVWPSAAIESWYRKQLAAITRGMQEDILPGLSAAWELTTPLLGGASDAPSRGQRAQVVLDKWSQRWTLRLNRLSVDLADKFADKSFRATQQQMAAAFKDAGLTVKFKTTPASMEAFRMTAAENVALIKSIPEQYAKDVRVKVIDSVKRGADLHTLTEDLKQSYGVSQRRAELIATDQNNKAKATIEDARRAELGIVEAIWMHSHAGKEPRPTHVAMNGKRYKIGKGMYDSEVDEYVLPGQLIRCRCSSRAVLPGFDG